MKNIKQIFLMLLFFVVILCYQLIVPFNNEIINSIIFSFVPSLFPCLLLINIILENDTLIFIYNKLRINVITRFIFVLILIFLSTIIGMPSLQLILKKLLDYKIIDKKDYNNFIISFGTISFPFLYGVCLINYEKNICLRIIIFFYFSNLINLFILGFKINNYEIIIKDKPLLNSLNRSIKISIKTMCIIVSTIFLFSLFLFLEEKIKIPYRYLIEGLIEFSYPCYKASKLKTISGELIVLFISLFPSLSIIFQSKIINNELNIKKYIFNRLLISFFSVSFYFFFF